MSQPIDTAYVNLEARGEDDAARDIKNALDDIKKDAKKISDDINKAFTDLFDDVEKKSKDTTDSIIDDVGRQGNAWQRAFHTINTTVRDSVNRTKASISNLTTNISQSFTQLQSTISKIRTTISSVTSTIQNGLNAIKPSTQAASRALAGLGIAGGPVGLSALLGAIALLAPAVVALGGALLDLVGVIGLIPAAGAVASAALATLALTFSGIGDAVKALAKGDIDKINEALAKLSPSAQRFARELNALRAPLSLLRKSVQEAFFSQFNGQLTSLVNTLLPSLRSGLSNISREFALIGISLINVIKSNENIKILNDVFASTARIVAGLRGPLTSLVDSFIKSIGAGLPFVERFFNAIFTGISRFSTFLTNAIASGDFNQFIEDSFSTLRDLGDLLAATGSLIQTVFGNAGDEGRSFIESLTLAITKLDEFLQTAEGQQELQNFISSAITLGEAIVSVTSGIVTLVRWVHNVKNTIDSVAAGFMGAVNAVVGFFSSIWSWVQTAGSAIAGFFTSIGQLFTSIGQWFADAYNSVVSFGGQIVAFFTSLPDRIVSGIQSLPERLAQFFLSVFDTVAYTIGFGIGTIIRFFYELPGNIISALTSLASLLGGFFTSISVNVISIIVRFGASIVSFFSGLPTRIGIALTQLLGTSVRIFNNLAERISNIASRIIESTVNFFRTLPERVSNAIKSLPERISNILSSIVTSAIRIGGQIIAGLGEGIMAGLGAVEALARRAARNILQGMKDALGISSPSRRARDEVGKEIMAGIDVGVTSQIPSLIQTLDNAMRSIMPTNTSVVNNADSFTFSILPGAIQISVMGNATHAEAQTIGAVVADELLNRVQQNRARLGVRITSGKL